MTAHPVDVHVGRRLREARLARGVTQEKLGALAEITFQQIQKYESGRNRISASKLYEFALVLFVDVSFFFDGLPKNLKAVRRSGRGRRST